MRHPSLDQICAAINADDAEHLYSLLATEAAIRR